MYAYRISNIIKGTCSVCYKRNYIYVIKVFQPGREVLHYYTVFDPVSKAFTSDRRTISCCSRNSISWLGIRWALPEDMQTVYKSKQQLMLCINKDYRGTI